MSIVALSLFIFNLLPLPHTDGSSLLRSLLALHRRASRHSLNYTATPKLGSSPAIGSSPSFPNSITAPGPSTGPISAQGSPHPNTHARTPSQTLTPLKATLATLATLNQPKSPKPKTPIKTPSINLSRQYELNSDDEDEYEEGGRSEGREGYDYEYAYEAFDYESGGEGRRREEAWKRRLRRSVEGGMMVLGTVWVAGWGMLSLLRSS